MTQLNRRRLFQVIGAAGLAPALSAFPARAAVSGTATSAQMLWASLYAQAGSGQQFVALARNFGISPNAAQGVYAKILGSRVLAAQGMRAMAPAAHPVPAVVHAKPSATSLWRRSLGVEVEKVLKDDTVEDAELVAQDDPQSTDSLKSNTDI